MKDLNNIISNINAESWESYANLWHELVPISNQSPLFMHPLWLKTWWQTLGREIEPHLLSVRNDETLMGLAPLAIEGRTAHFLGSPDVCDYFDFIVSTDKAHVFFDILIAFLQSNDIQLLDLGPIREDSIAYAFFTQPEKQIAVRIEPDEVSYEMDLPDTWDAYLQGLDGKQRHEVRRKFRRLHEAAQVDFNVVQNLDHQPEALDTFLTLFSQNRSDKADFMTDDMTAYFRSLVTVMGDAQMLRLFSLDLDGQKAASVLCFDDGETLYLYNNGYDNRFSSLSIGLISKLMTIEHAINMGKKRYNFLKGTESYKHHLGGKPVDLFRLRIDLESMI